MPDEHFERIVAKMELEPNIENKVEDSLSVKVNKRHARNKFIERISKNCLKKKDYAVIIASFIVMIASIAMMFIFQNEFLAWHNSRLQTILGLVIYIVGLSASILSLFSILIFKI